MRDQPPSTRLRTAAAVARSGARRYPAELAQSLRTRCAPREALPLSLPPNADAAPLAAVWLGHATVLLRLDNTWILTDPVFSHRIGLSLGPLVVGLGRRLPPFDHRTIPTPDLILLSHAHFDHLDKPSLRRLASPTTRVITAQKTSGLVPKGFGEVIELPWDQSVRVGPLTINSIRPAHWGARTAWDRHRGFNSYLLSSPSRRVLFAGDTAYTDAFSAVGGVDLSIFGIGAYDPWIANHANPEQAWAMHQQAGGQFLLPIHHSTFKLSDEPHDEPLKRLLAAAGDDSHRIIGHAPGQLWLL